MRKVTNILLSEVNIKNWKNIWNDTAISTYIRLFVVKTVRIIIPLQICFAIQTSVLRLYTVISIKQCYSGFSSYYCSMHTCVCVWCMCTS